jgi:hypothetical protein
VIIRGLPDWDKQRMLGNNQAFRAQLVVPEQRQLFDYWLKCAGINGFPARSDIKPFEFPKLLPGISLIDIDGQELTQSRVRLAGTKLREIYDREITGSCIGALDWEDKHDYWCQSYRRVVQEKLPAQGVVRGPRRHKEHVVQYWLKLPLGPVNGAVNMVLCYDHFIPATEQQRLQVFATSA